MRLKRCFVPYFRPEQATAMAEFMLMHGIDTVTLTDRPDRPGPHKLQVDCFYAVQA